MSQETAIIEKEENGAPDSERLNALAREITAALDARERKRLQAIAKEIHSADLGAVLELLDSPHRVDFIKAIRRFLDPEVLTELEGGAFEDVVGVLKNKELAQAVSQLETDDAVYVLEELEDAAHQQKILDKVKPADRAAIEAGLGYPEETAGRLMQRDLIAVPEHWDVGRTIDFMREEEHLPHDFYEIFVVDPRFKPIGTVSLNRLLRTKRPVKIGEIMNPDFTKIPADMDQEDAANLFRQYNLVSAPVINADGRLVGVITVDDIVDVIDAEAEEDILALAGVHEGDLNVTARQITRTRFIWLVVNLGTAVLASYVISFFEDSITKLVALAVLMPIVASMGGNAGTQTLAVAVRALAMNELTMSNLWRVMKTEVMGGLINGALLALITGVLAALWFDSPQLGAVIGAAMVINLVVAGLSGLLVPVTLHRLKIDPAVASSIFVTTVTDVVGFFAFLGLAAWVML